MKLSQKWSRVIWWPTVHWKIALFKGRHVLVKDSTLKLRTCFMFPFLIFLQYILCLQSMNLPNLAMMDWAGDMGNLRKKGCTWKPEPKNQISGRVNHDISSTYNNFQRISFEHTLFIGPEIRLHLKWCVSCTRQANGAYLVTPPKVPLFLQKKEKLEMNIWKFCGWY